MSTFKYGTNGCDKIDAGGDTLTFGTINNNQYLARVNSSIVGLDGINNTYDAIIPDDYGQLSLAITDNKTNIFIRNGIYSESADITIPENTTITGESPVDAGIDLNGNKILIGTTPNVYASGTVSLTNGSNIITGNGTTFTVGMIGQQISFGNFWYLISGFTSTTQLTMANNWVGNNAVNIPYQIVETTRNVNLRNLLLFGSSDYCILAKGWTNSIIEGLVMYNAGGIRHENCGVIKYNNCYFDQNFQKSGDECIQVRGCFAMQFDQCNFSRAPDSGFIASALNGLQSQNIKVANCISTGNGGNGFHMSSDNGSLSNCTASYNNSNGFTISTGSNIYTSLTTSQSFGNSDSGVFINNTTDRVIIDGCVFDNNGGRGIYTQGDASIITNNICTNNGLDGITLVCNNTIASGNICANNTGGGLIVFAGTNNMAYGNRCTGNTGSNFNSSGSVGTSVNGDNVTI